MLLTMPVGIFQDGALRPLRGDIGGNGQGGFNLMKLSGLHGPKGRIAGPIEAPLIAAEGRGSGSPA